jgi:signal transduction histidine kinase/CHASE1-domain containing sensor protein
MRLISILILLAGVIGASLFLGLGLAAVERTLRGSFDDAAEGVVYQVDIVMDTYLQTVLWATQACQGCSEHAEENHMLFRDFHDYLSLSSLPMIAEGYVVNVSQAERVHFESDQRGYLGENYPEVDYEGIRAFDPLNVTFGVSPERDYYLPIHYLEPVLGNEQRIDFDLNSMRAAAEALEVAASQGGAVLSGPLCFVNDPLAILRVTDNSVVLVHPDIRELEAGRAQGFGLSLVRARNIFEFVAAHSPLSNTIYVHAFDVTNADYKPFITAVRFDPWNSCDDDGIHKGDAEDGYENHCSSSKVTALSSISYDEFHATLPMYVYETTLSLATREWNLVVTASGKDFPANLVFVILGAAVILCSCCCLAWWLYSDHRKTLRMQQILSKSEGEKALLMLNSARATARTERELNDFIAHEVRNPLSAAISACSFVSSAVNETIPLTSEESRESVRSDVGIIGESLHFINDLLRSMLDMHRASSNQLTISLEPTDVRSDILEPVATMLHHREENFEVVVVCPDGLFVMADKLRLKQIILNLGRNAAKFVREGFVKLRADVIDDEVCLFVEDSGPGIPLEKRKKLFNKFQDSLDSLHQGTGIGLALCRHLIDLMGGDISLDNEYDSGVEGNPGAKLIIHLHTTPLVMTDREMEGAPHLRSGRDAKSVEGSGDQSRDKIARLPTELSVLFVDDDMLLRKLFIRSVKRLAPTWEIKQAANGETAIRMATAEKFSLIFMDQYMASGMSIPTNPLAPSHVPV